MLEVFENNASRICTTIEELKSLEASYITNIDSEDETNELVSCSRRSLGYFPQPPRNSTSTTCNSQQKDVVQHPHRDAKGAVIAGNLFLREKKLWTKKFCEVTCDAEFLCFDVQNKKKLEYHFCIPGAVVRRTISREHQYAFQVEVFQVVQKKKKKKVTYYFYTTSKEDMSKWIKGIVNQGAELKEPRTSITQDMSDLFRKVFNQNIIKRTVSVDAGQLKKAKFEKLERQKQYPRISSEPIMRSSRI